MLEINLAGADTALLHEQFKDHGFVICSWPVLPAEFCLGTLKQRLAAI